MCTRQMLLNICRSQVVGEWTSCIHSVSSLLFSKRDIHYQRWLPITLQIFPNCFSLIATQPTKGSLFNFVTSRIYGSFQNVAKLVEFRLLAKNNPNFCVDMATKHLGIIHLFQWSCRNNNKTISKKQVTKCLAVEGV